MQIDSVASFTIWRRLFRRTGPGVTALFLVWASFVALPQAAKADIGAWIVIDAETGAVLDEQDATRRWYPASVTKLMTAYVAFKAIRDGKATPQSVVTYSANAAAEPPSKMGFKVGTQLTLDNALKMLLIKSANDIAVAVAETVGGSEEEFIAMMNAEASRMGLSATHFVNPHGLPDNRQVSSARDLAVLAMILWREFPDYRDYFGHSGARFGKKLLKSANREYLARVEGANGLKTGFICNSGYNVAVSATRGSRTVIAVIVGAGSGLERLALSRQLIDKGFRTKNGRSVSALTGVGGPPPADGYCKTNPKLSAEELASRYGGSAKSKRPAGLPRLWRQQGPAVFARAPRRGFVRLRWRRRRFRGAAQGQEDRLGEVHGRTGRQKAAGPRTHKGFHRHPGGCGGCERNCAHRRFFGGGPVHSGNSCGKADCRQAGACSFSRCDRQSGSAIGGTWENQPWRHISWQRDAKDAVSHRKAGAIRPFLKIAVPTAKSDK